MYRSESQRIHFKKMFSKSCQKETSAVFSGNDYIGSLLFSCFSLNTASYVVSREYKERQILHAVVSLGKYVQ